MRPTVLLFDIDGTLISSGGAGRRAMEGAFVRRFDRADACSRINFGGMTDRAIARAGLEAIGARCDDAAIEALLSTYLEILHEQLAPRAAAAIERESAPSSSPWRIHEGIHAALDAAEKKAATAIGLGTGNVRRGAELKLGHVDLFHRFSFGGFGCDHESRPDLLRIGAERGAKQLGAALAECRVVVIGDTPKDIAAAKASGAESLAVATGGFTIDVLRENDPTYAFPSLGSPGALAALLGED